MRVAIPSHSSSSSDNKFKTGFVNVNGTNLFWRGSFLPIQKEKALVVFLHCVPGSSASFECQLENFREHGYSVFAPDIRGNGHSEASFVQSDYTPVNLAADVRAMLIALGLTNRPAIFFGVSIGGLISIQYFLDNPGAVSRLVLVGVTAALSASGFPFTISPLTAAVLNEVFVDYALAAAEFPDLWFNETCDPKRIAKLKQLMTEINLQATQFAIESIIINFGPTDYRPILGTINIPVLILQGTIDQVYNMPVGAAEFLRDNIPDAFLILFEDKGHQPQLTDFKRVDKDTRDWIEGELAECDICLKIKP